MPNCRILYFYKKLVSVRDTPPSDGVGVLLLRGDKKQCKNVKFYYNRWAFSPNEKRKVKSEKLIPTIGFNANEMFKIYYNRKGLARNKNEKWKVKNAPSLPSLCEVLNSPPSPLPKFREGYSLQREIFFGGEMFKIYYAEGIPLGQLCGFGGTPPQPLPQGRGALKKGIRNVEKILQQKGVWELMVRFLPTQEWH